MEGNWSERDLGWKYTADFSRGETYLHILMSHLTGHNVELDGRINAGSVDEMFTQYQELPDFLARHKIPAPPTYEAAWKSQHPRAEKTEAKEKWYQKLRAWFR